MNETEKTTFLSDLRRYEQILAAALSGPTDFAPSVENPLAIQVERSVILAQAVTRGPATHLSIADAVLTSPRAAVIDAAGHQRSIYRPMLIYATLQAFRILYESLPRSEFGRWDESMRACSDLLESDLGLIHLPADAIPADHGAAASQAAWTALALFVAGKIFIRDAWTDLASDTFGRLSKVQCPTGPFLASTALDNPELLWYHELTLLHAAASYAVQAEDRHLSVAVRKASDFHLRETQPDHATNHPFALFAFIWNPHTRTLADQLLLTAQASHPAGLDGISLLLLADSLYCLRLFLQ